MNDFELKAYVANLGKYNEGELAGEWVTFPVTAEQMREVYDRIGIGKQDEYGNPYEEVFIADYDTDLYGLAGELGEYSSLEAINYLAGRLTELDRYDLEKFRVVLDSGMGIPQNGVDGLINLTFNLDRYELIPDVRDDTDLGYYYVEEAGIYDTKDMGVLARYIDYESLGRDIRLEEGGMYGDKGYIRDDGSDWVYEFDGSKENIPEEYHLSTGTEDRQMLSTEEQELVTRAMEAAGYTLDRLESTEDNLRFFSEGGAVLQLAGWQDTKDWLEGGVFDDPEASDRVEGILHPERFPDRDNSWTGGKYPVKPDHGKEQDRLKSVLKALDEKRSEIHYSRPQDQQNEKRTAITRSAGER